MVLSQCKTTSAYEEPRSSGNDCTNSLVIKIMAHYTSPCYLFTPRSLTNTPTAIKRKMCLRKKLISPPDHNTTLLFTQFTLYFIYCTAKGYCYPHHIMYCSHSSSPLHRAIHGLTSLNLSGTNPEEPCTSCTKTQQPTIHELKKEEKLITDLPVLVAKLKNK